MSVWSCCSEKSSCTVSVFAATLTFSYLFSKQMYCFIVEFYVAVNSSDNYSRSVSIQFCYTGAPMNRITSLVEVLKRQCQSQIKLMLLSINNIYFKKKFDARFKWKNKYFFLNLIFFPRTFFGVLFWCQ